jgi:hypothetical protein
MKVKIIKKGAEIKQKGKPVNEARSKRAAAREMVANVSDWVSDLQDRKRREARLAFETLFGNKPQTT